MPTTELPPRSGVSLNELRVRVCAPRSSHAEVSLRPKQGVVVGSSSAADLTLEEPTVSQRHVRLEHRGSYVLAVDLGSKNGTTLLGHRVTAVEVVPGARLRLGAATIEIVDASSPASHCASGERLEQATLPGLVGSSLPMQRLAQRVRRYAPLVEPVLVRGESGTGKELVARALHDLNPSRAKAAFVAINAASLSRELAESELFGHRRGAFTGAVTDRAGAFREASGGTLFIDEIAQLGPEVQAKLLRAVEDGVVRALGADGAVQVDVRLVAATCEPLEELVEQRRFRADLYERIAACVVRVPALRERLDDLPELAHHLLRKMSVDGARRGSAIAAGSNAGAALAPSGLAALARCKYRGNVRELRNLLLHALLLAGPTAVIEEEHIVSAWSERTMRSVTRISSGEARLVLAACDGNVSEAARRLGMPRTTLRDLIAKNADETSAQNAPTTEAPCTSGDSNGMGMIHARDAASLGLALEPPYQSTMT